MKTQHRTQPEALLLDALLPDTLAPDTAKADSGGRERLRPSGVRAALLETVDEFAGMVEKYPQPVMAVLVFLYILVCAWNNRRPVWYDELTTNLAAQVQVPLLHFGGGMRESLQHGVLSPLFVRVSTGLFGMSPWAYRLPSSLGYLAASALLFTFLRRARLGNLFALFGVLIFWSTPSFFYATEARPYGLILGFAGVLFVAWQAASTTERRGWALAAIPVAEVCLMLSHPLAILAVLPIAAAEVTRFVIRKKPDWPLWLSIGWPGLGIFPLFLFRPIHPAFSPALTGRLTNGISFYLENLHAVALPLMLAAFGALVTATARAVKRDDTGPAWLRPAEYALASGGLAIPFLVNAILAATSSNPYFPRYSISATFCFPLLAALILATRTERNPRAGLFALAAALVCFLTAQASLQQPGTWNAPPVASAALVESHKDLPFVAASGLTFIEMGDREPAEFLSRVFYLRDSEAAVHYANSGLFETKDFVDYQSYVPRHGIVSPLTDFTRTHKRFLVYGTVNYWEDWLLRKLVADGAQLVWLGQVRGTYKDTDLYEVTLKPETAGLAATR